MVSFLFLLPGIDTVAIRDLNLYKKHKEQHAEVARVSNTREMLRKANLPSAPSHTIIINLSARMITKPTGKTAGSENSRTDFDIVLSRELGAQPTPRLSPCLPTLPLQGRLTILRPPYLGRRERGKKIPSSHQAFPRAVSGAPCLAWRLDSAAGHACLRAAQLRSARICISAVRCSRAVTLVSQMGQIVCVVVVP